MKALARFEAFVEGLMEGPFARLFGGGIQPVQIAKLMQREMETKQAVGPGKVFVPNLFIVGLHPDDHAEIAPVAQALERELVAYTLNLASERSYSFLGPVSVSIQPDVAAHRHQARVQSRSDAAAGAVGPHASPLDRTQALDTAQVRSAVTTAARAELWIQDDRETRVVPLDGSVVAIGRSIDNDLIVEHGSVSRHHAEIRREAGRFSVTDLHSTNGTLLNGRRIVASYLQNGDRLRLGEIEAVFRLVDTGEP